MRDPNCILWKGRPDSQGYGRISVDGFRDRAHRQVWRHYFGPIPEGLEIEHICQTKLCINPRHLQAVPHAKNMERERLETCMHGHSLADAYRRSNGGRTCRTCTTIRNHAKRSLV